MIATAHLRADIRTWWREHPVVLLRDLIQRSLLFPALRWLCRPLAVEGVERLDGVRGPVIFVANHSSHFDTLLLLSVLPRGVRRRTAVAAAADYFFCGCLRGAVVSLLVNAFAFKRNGCPRRSLDRCRDLLRGGGSLLIYPEGGRSPDGRLQRFKPGIGLLATAAGVPVVPIYLRGARDLLPKGGLLPRPGAVAVRIGEPVRCPRDADPLAVADDLRSRVIELAGKIRLDIGHHKTHDPREDAAAGAVSLPRRGQRRCDNDPVLS